VKSATNTVDFAVPELGNGRCVLKELVVIEGGGYAVREAKDISVPCDKVGSSVGIARHCKRGSMLSRSKIWGLNRAVAVIVASQLVKCGSQVGLYKLERYSHEGYLIRAVVMALAGEVTQKLSPIQSWSNKNYEI